MKMGRGPKKFAEDIPEEVIVLGAVSAEQGFEALAITDADGELALPVFSDDAKLGRAVQDLIRGTPTMEDLKRRGFVTGGVSFSFQEAARMALDAGCDYIGLDMGQDTSFRTFYLHAARGGEDS